MSVHEAISKHSRKQHEDLQEFLRLDSQREQHIEEALQLCREGRPFTVARINEVTRRIQQLALNAVVPARTLVTEDMVRDYAAKGSAEQK